MVKNNKIALVVFDMAGTTVNENNIVYKTLQKAINNAGYSLSLEFVLKHAAGKEKKQAIIDILEQDNEVNEVLVDTVFNDFKGLLSTAYKEMEISTYPGTTELFSLLRRNKVKVALNTGYDLKTARQLVSKLNWSSGVEFDLLVTASDVERGRPEPEMIFLAMEKLGVTDSKLVVKIGDSIIDVEEGKNAKCGLSIGVTTGAHTREQIETASPDFIINSLMELENILLKA